MSEPQAREYWKTHYDAMAQHESLYLFEAEASDFFRRIDRTIALDSRHRALDFGCGLGFVAELLCSKVHSLHFWDYSSNMLEAATVRLQDTPNSHPVDLSSDNDDYAEYFDLVFVNSVIQYMSRGDLSDWLGRWRGMLRPDGTLIVSDVIWPKPAFFTEVFDSLMFSAKEGFLVRTLKKDMGQYLRYLKARSQADLARYSKDDIRQLAAENRLHAAEADYNLTYRSNRFSMLLTPR